VVKVNNAQESVADSKPQTNGSAAGRAIDQFRQQIARFSRSIG
jgi:hypothetical protein